MHRSTGTRFFAWFLDPVVALSLGFALTFAVAPAFADAYADGVNQLNSRKFPLAITSFKSALKANPKNAMAQYYLGLAMHYKGDTQGALTAYSKVLTTFPGSNASQLAVRGMASIDPSILQKLGLVSPQQQPAARASGSSGVSSYSGSGQQSSSGAGNPGDYIPDECRVYCTREFNCLVLDTRVSNRPLKMMFDTGAEATVLGKNHLQELGLPLPTGNSVGTASGVGEGGGQRYWISKIDITVGNITRKNFPVCVQENMPGMPLLGQNFFNQMRYTIDNGANSIHFVKKQSSSGGSIYSSGANDPNAVPFVKEGNEIVVVVEVNGRKMPMIFDTGASGLAMTYPQCQQLGITIPDDAQHTSSQGIAGNTAGRAFPVRVVRMGPIEKRDFEINVISAAQMPHPLLGQTFYQDYQYTIDYDKKLIHFIRR